MNWEQLQKDVEAVNSDEGDAPALYSIMKKAPDLAALALAGKRLADAGKDLDKAVADVARYGAQTGSQWTRLASAHLKFRAALKETDK